MKFVVVLQVVGLNEHEIVWEGWSMQEAGRDPDVLNISLSVHRKNGKTRHKERCSLFHERVKEGRWGYAAPGMPAEWWQLRFSIL